MLRQYKVDLIARFEEVESVNPKLIQDQKAKEIGRSSSTLKRYRHDINRLSPYKNPPNNTHKRKQKISNTTLDDKSNQEHELEKRQMTTEDLK